MGTDMKKKLRIGALVSGGGTNLQAILDACESGAITGKVVFVGSDKPGAYGLKRAGKRGIPGFSVDYAGILKESRNQKARFSFPDGWDFEDILRKQSLFPPQTPLEKLNAFFLPRAVAEAALLEHMAPYPFDLLVLAGFMRILTPFFIDRVNTNPKQPRILNIHPALLPAFPGTDGYGDAFRYGCKVAGCTVHFVDYGEDSGPIIAQRAFPIEEGDTEAGVREKGLRIEWELYPQCIALYAQKRLKVLETKHRLQDGRKPGKPIVRILPEKK